MTEAEGEAEGEGGGERSLLALEVQHRAVRLSFVQGRGRGGRQFLSLVDGGDIGFSHGISDGFSRQVGREDGSGVGGLSPLGDLEEKEEGSCSVVEDGISGGCSEVSLEKRGGVITLDGGGTNQEKDW